MKKYTAYINFRTEDVCVLEEHELDPIPQHLYTEVGNFWNYSDKDKCIKDMLCTVLHLSDPIKDKELKRILKKNYPNIIIHYDV